MRVRGEDDLALLATSFNAMAANLQEQITRLEELSRVQQRFVSDVSHELRTPLTTVRMAADVLYESRDEFDPATARSAELLQTQLDRFEALLADLLEISRFDAGAAVLDADARRPPRARRARRSRPPRPLAERKGTPVLDRAARPPSCLVEADARRIDRVLRNLVVNAIEHGEGRPVEVTVAAATTARSRSPCATTASGLRPGRVVAGVQPLLARRPGARPHHRRHRARPVDRARGRAAARRLAAGLGRARATARTSGSRCRRTADSRRSTSRRCRSSRPTPARACTASLAHAVPRTPHARRCRDDGTGGLAALAAGRRAALTGCAGVPTSGPIEQGPVARPRPATTSSSGSSRARRGPA